MKQAYPILPEEYGEFAYRVASVARSLIDRCAIPGSKSRIRPATSSQRIKLGFVAWSSQNQNRLVALRLQLRSTANRKTVNYEEIQAVGE